MILRPVPLVALLLALAAPGRADPLPPRRPPATPLPSPKAAPADAVADRSDEADPDGAKPRPGRFGQEPTEIPGQFIKGRTVAPKKPDIAVPLGRRTTIGVFQESSRPEPHVTAPGRGPRELGAGITLEHRFGGP